MVAIVPNYEIITLQDQIYMWIYYYGWKKWNILKKVPSEKEDAVAKFTLYCPDIELTLDEDLLKSSYGKWWFIMDSKDNVKEESTEGSECASEVSPKVMLSDMNEKWDEAVKEESPDDTVIEKIKYVEFVKYKYCCYLCSFEGSRRCQLKTHFNRHHLHLCHN